MFCECCQSASGITAVSTWFGGKKYRSRLCQDCRVNGHFFDACLKCNSQTGEVALIWHCARLSHVINNHYGVIERRLNAPTDPKIEPRFQFLGKLPLQVEASE